MSDLANHPLDIVIAILIGLALLAGLGDYLDWW